MTRSGESIDVVIGRDRSDPQFTVSDLLPHLAGDQMKKSLSDGISAESMNILAGSVPYDDEGSERVKLAVMAILNSRYGITEEDFISAELYAVPAFDVRDIGLDRSLIGGYGHDDRVCAYAELRALFDLKGTPKRTAVCILKFGPDGFIIDVPNQLFRDKERAAANQILSNGLCTAASWQNDVIV